MQNNCLQKVSLTFFQRQDNIEKEKGMTVKEEICLNYAKPY